MNFRQTVHQSAEGASELFYSGSGGTFLKVGTFSSFEKGTIDEIASVSWSEILEGVCSGIVGRNSYEVLEGVCSGVVGGNSFEVLEGFSNFVSISSSEDWLKICFHLEDFLN